MGKSVKIMLDLFCRGQKLVKRASTWSPADCQQKVIKMHVTVAIKTKVLPSKLGACWPSVKDFLFQSKRLCPLTIDILTPKKYLTGNTQEDVASSRYD